MATQATHVRRKNEGEKSEKNSEISEASISAPTRQQRSSRTKPPPGNPPLKGKVRKNEGPFLTDNENFNETGVLSGIKESTTVDLIPPAGNKSAVGYVPQPVINESIVDNTLPAIGARFNDDSFLPLNDYSKVTLQAGNNTVMDITNPPSYNYNTSFITGTVDNNVVVTNIGPADSSRGAYAYDFATMSTQEAIPQYSSARNSQEITRVTLSSIHKVEGIKEPVHNKAESASIIHNIITSENIIEKTIGHTDTGVFDVPTTPIIMDKLANKTDENMIAQTNPMIDAGSNELQNENEARLNNERTCEGGSSNVHIVRAGGSSEISSPNLQHTAESRPSAKGAGRGRPKKAVTKSDNQFNIAEGASNKPKAGRGRPKKVKPSETQAGTVEGITTEVKFDGNESLPVVEGLSVAAVDENMTKTVSTTKVKYGKRGRPSKAAQAGGLVTNPTDGTISEPTSVPRKRGRPRKETTNNDNSSASLIGVKIGGKTSKRGRPRKFPKVESHLDKSSTLPAKHSGRGRPRKVPKKFDETKDGSTTIVKKRGRPRKEVSESSEPNKVTESGEPKDAPESTEPKDVSESIELKDASESTELKDAAESNDPKDKYISATVEVKTNTGKRGRPKKISKTEGPPAEHVRDPTISKKRGRPKKEISENDEPKAINVKAGKRGRPRKKQKDDEPSAGSNEPGVASSSVEPQPEIGNARNDENATTVSTVNVDRVIMTTEEVTVGGAEEIQEESVDELIDELTAK